MRAEQVNRSHGLEAFLESAEPDSGGALQVRIETGLALVNLRGDPRDPAFREAAEAALGQTLPLRANTSSIGPHRSYWLGPDEWLVTTTLGGLHELLSRLDESLAGLASCNEVGGGMVALWVSGPATREVLAKGCPLDLHPDAFPVGACARSVLAKAGIFLSLHDDTPTFLVVVARSYADYLARWLRQAARAEGGAEFVVGDW